MQATAERYIKTVISSQGPITFAEFMETALYYPDGGYYLRADFDGDLSRDYFTSPEAHPAFGALIAIQIWWMWKLMGNPTPMYLIETGAGNRVLARDVLDYSKKLPVPFQDALSYITVDRSFFKSARNQQTSAFDSVISSGIPFDGVVGCFLSNEIVDSFPVHRFQIQDGAIREIFVSLLDGEFTEILGAPSTPLLGHRLDSLGLVLPDGYRGEINLGIGPWVAELDRALQSGFVITIDYGYEAQELYSLRRPLGTLQTYYRHSDLSSPYIRVGAQDITAHVDFSTLASEGESRGLESLGLFTQAQYLLGLGIERWIREVNTLNLTQFERDANVMAMRELISPDGLGGFKVLVQKKGENKLDVAELAPLETLTGSFPTPLLGPDHIQLMEGRYPHSGWQWDELGFHDRG